MSPSEYVIKRYANRKLYDPHQRRYVNLREVAEIVRSGEDVRIVDSRTEEDLTRTVLVQIILDEQRESDVGPSLGSLFQLVRTGTEQLTDFVKRHAPAQAGSVGDLGAELERLVAGWISAGKLSWEEGARVRREMASNLQKLVTDARASVERGVNSTLQPLAQRYGLEDELSQLWHRLQQWDPVLFATASAPASGAEPQAAPKPPRRRVRKSKPHTTARKTAKRSARAGKKKTTRRKTSGKKTARKSSQRGGKTS